MRLLRELGYSHVSHFLGGLTEWFSEEAPAPTAHASLPAAHVAPRISHPVPRTSLSASFVDALADRSVGALFRLWTEIVLGCGAAYWLLAWSSPRFALLSNGAPVAASLRGLLPAIYSSAVTATSIGYGDIVPQGVARLLAVFEGIAGLILFGCVARSSCRAGRIG